MRDLTPRDGRFNRSPPFRPYVSLLTLHPPLSGRQHHPALDELKAKAKAQGLWNLFLPRETDGGKYGAGFTNLEYALMAEVVPSLLPPLLTTHCGRLLDTLLLLLRSSTAGLPLPPLHSLTTVLPAPSVPPTRATWRCSLGTAPKSRRPSGSSLS
jgi:alkylation response protein AidB-like acyl-CoA dehydrogenase